MSVCFKMEGMTTLRGLELDEAGEQRLQDVIPMEPCPDADATVAAMRAVNAKLEEEDLGHLLAFARTYLHLSETVANAIRMGRKPPHGNGIFDEPETVNRTVGIFADYWFKQLRAHLGLTAETVDPAWRQLFYDDRAEHAQPGVQFLLGMNAHINYDLPQALRDSRVSEGYYLDYQLVIGMLIDQTARELDKVYIPGPQVSRDMLRFGVVNMIANWRENAWQSGMHLMMAEKYGQKPDKSHLSEALGGATVRVMAREALETGEFILSAGALALNGLARVAKYNDALHAQKKVFAERVRRIWTGN